MTPEQIGYEIEMANLREKIREQKALIEATTEYRILEARYKRYVEMK